MTASTVLLLAGHRYVLAGAVDWSLLASEVAGLQLTAKWETPPTPRWGALWLTVPGETRGAVRVNVGGFDYMLAGHDQATQTPIYVINSTVVGRWRGSGLGKLGYLLVFHYLTTTHRGWLIPDAARGEETSPSAQRVWQTLPI